MVTTGLTIDTLMSQAANIDLNMMWEGDAGIEELVRIGTDQAALTAQSAFASSEIHRWPAMIAGHEYGGGTVVNAEPAVKADIGPMS